MVRTEAPYTQTQGVGTNRGPIAAAVLDRVRDVDGVAAAEGSVQGYALLTDTDGQARSPPTVAPRPTATACPPTRSSAATWSSSPAAPRRRGHEVAIDATSAEEHDIALG